MRQESDSLKIEARLAKQLKEEKLCRSIAYIFWGPSVLERYYCS